MDAASVVYRLMNIAPPPEHPVDIRGLAQDWAAVQATIGTELPSDYKMIIDAYGSGDFCDLLIILNPFCSNQELNLIHQVGTGPDLYGSMLETYNAGRFGEFACPEQCPFLVFPEPGGLFPLARDSNGGDMFWLTKGRPDSWPLVRYNWRAGYTHERHDLSIGEFLAEWLQGGIPSAFGGVATSRVFKRGPIFCPLGRVRGN